MRRRAPKPDPCWYVVVMADGFRAYRSMKHDEALMRVVRHPGATIQVEPIDTAF